MYVFLFASSSDILFLRHRESPSSFIRARMIILQFREGVVQVYNTYIVFIIRFRLYDRPATDVADGFFRASDALSLPSNITAREMEIHRLWKLARLDL